MKRVLAIHDLSGFGRCSLAVIAPIISAMGVQCCQLPTAFLSTHTGGFTGFTFHDMTDEMPKILEHYKTLELEFDAIYSGFLGSMRQTEIVADCISSLRTEKMLALIDPVMGDHGKPYRTYTPEMLSGMGTLADMADVITPNLTEAAILLGVPYEKAPDDEAGMREWLTALSRNGERSVVVTGLSFSEGTVGCGYFERESGKSGFSFRPYVGDSYPGTGDVFASALLASLLSGIPLPAAVDIAAGFVYDCCEVTFAAGTPRREGVAFEPLLIRLMTAITGAKV
ncbi:pyridoxamine kinase [Oscillospiraceae bacterium OttesenSCG-928-G22]|nr:pyridoxamine kinase [Oscillospiraceae bacterium OttesenSCG-928-G22]